MTRASGLIWLPAVLLTWTVAAPAQALQCAKNADCPKGFECQEVGTADCPDIACVDGEACDPVDCTSETFSECMPLDCSSDDDCADGMVCDTETDTVCETTPCAAGEKCPDAETSCQDVARNYCAPKYLLPCEVDSDCGPGFTCSELESCACSGGSGSAGGAEPAPSNGTGGSGGTPDADTGAAPPPDSQESCTCEPSGNFQCQLDEVACDSDADCDDGFTCEDNPEGGVCSGSSDGQSSCTEPDPAKLCLPPYFDLGFGVGRGGVAQDSGKATGAAGDSGEAEDNSNDTSTAKRSSGCQLGGAVGGLPGDGLAGLLVLAGVVARRRRPRR